MNDGGPAFPILLDVTVGKMSGRGVTVRDYFAIHSPEPSEEAILMERDVDRRRNPHNDYYRPKLRSPDEIEAYFRYRFADAMLAEREKE